MEKKISWNSPGAQSRYLAPRRRTPSYATGNVKGHPFMTSTRRGRGQAQVDACGRGEGSSPMWTSTQKLKLESIDMILSSSHAKKLVYFLPEFRLWTE